ncbi:unnamed protein product [Caenorhabditis sp. 36 PRJEB53466]|nr:unnamed protein product [Caenorhabditis sp. 36 PRJEB53466]
MKKSCILSLFLLAMLTSTVSAVCSSNSTFNLTLSEEKKSFKRREFHIFYEPQLRSFAEMVKCQVSATVNSVSLDEIQPGKTLEHTCALEIYTKKVEDPRVQRSFMATITNQKKFLDSTACDAHNQLNFMKTPKNEWAVQIRGLVTDILLPMNSSQGNFTAESLNFALDALFFASSYGFGDATFKSLGDGNFKKKLLIATAVVYMLVLLSAVAVIVVLLVLMLLKRRANIKKRESDRSNLLRNPANNNCDDGLVDVVYDDSADNKS